MHDIDVHVICTQHFNDQQQRWFDKCMDSLKDEPVNIHRTEYVDGDIRAARWNGFSRGTGRYVSFVDPDDWVEPGIFSYVQQRLDNRPDVCGAYTLSHRVYERNGEEIDAGLLHKFNRWPLPATGSLVDIHQLTVMRREDCLRVYEAAYDQIPRNVHEMTWVYWEMAKTKPWLPIDRVGYYWRQREDGAHRMYNDEIAESLRLSMKHMLEIRRSIASR